MQKFSRWFQVMLVFAGCGFAVAHGDEKVLSSEEAASLLDDMAAFWQATQQGWAGLSGSGDVYQSQYVTNVSLQDQAPLEGRFNKVDLAKVDFRCNWQDAAHWCRWRMSEPSHWIDLGEGTTVAEEGVGGDVICILTEADYFYQSVGSRLQSIHGGMLPEALRKIDEDQQREVLGGKRKVVFRNTTETGKAFIERGSMLTASSLFGIGGKLPAEYLDRVAKGLRRGSATKVRVVPGVILGQFEVTVEQMFRSSPDAPPTLSVVTNWLQSKISPSDSKSWLLDSVTMSYANEFDGDESAGNVYETKWSWGNDVLELKEWDFTVRAAAGFDPNFHRHIDITNWSLVDPHANSLFSTDGLDVAVGDLIYDQEAQMVSYVTSEGGLIDTGKVVFPVEPDEPVSVAAFRGYFFWLNLGVLAIFFIVWTLTRRNTIADEVKPH